MLNAGTKALKMGSDRFRVRGGKPRGGGDDPAHTTRLIKFSGARPRRPPLLRPRRRAQPPEAPALRLRKPSISQRRNLQPIRKKCQNRSARQSRRRTKKESATVKTGKGSKGKRQKAKSNRCQVPNAKNRAGATAQGTRSFENCMRKRHKIGY